MNILVTNAKNRIAYNVVKNLAARGHQVYCADFVPRAMSNYSRYTKGHFLYPSPFSKQDEFIECLLAKIQELEIDVLFPVFEELFLIARNKQRFLQHVKLAVPDYSQILTAHNKDRWEPIASRLGIPVPETYSISKLQEDLSLLDKLTDPLLLKPKQGGGGWGIGEVSVEDLAAILTAGSYQGHDLDRYIVQQKIQGETICVAMVLSDGKLLGKTCYRQIREYPAFSGQATCRVSISNIAAEDSIEKLLEHLGWHGVCQVDFVVETQTGIPYLIDINPRFWGSLAQGIASGVDFPHLVCEIATHGDVQRVGSFKVGVQTRWLGGELRGFFQHLTKADNKTAFIRDFFWPVTRTECFDDFNLADPLPFMAWCMDSLCRLVKFRGNAPHESLEGTWK